MAQETFLALLGGGAPADDLAIQDYDSPNGELAAFQGIGCQGQALSHIVL